MLDVRLMIYEVRNRIQQSFYLSAPGGYSMYWAIIIGVIVVSAYLVGGFIPKRFPDLRNRPEVQMPEKQYTDEFPTLQLRSLAPLENNPAPSQPAP
jgi:hypothetical protein